MSKKVKNGRVDYSRISGDLALPHLIEVQTKSYEWFIRSGIHEVLKGQFPIKAKNEKYTLSYDSSYLKPAKYTFLECKEQGLTYASSLRVKLRAELHETGEIKETEVFLGDIPLMTESGTFIVSGSERVIVSQIVRSPSAYVIKNEKKTKANKIDTYSADLIPQRGAWLQFENDKKGVWSVYINRDHKLNATVFLKALGLSYADMINLFGNDEMLVDTIMKDTGLDLNESLTHFSMNGDYAQEALEEIYQKVKPSDPRTKESVQQYLINTFFDAKRHELGRAGRLKVNRKLGIYNRLVDNVLAEPLVNADGEIRLPKGTKVTVAMVKELINEEFFENGAHAFDLTINKNIDSYSTINIVKVEKNGVVYPIVGTDMTITEQRMTIPDAVALFSYLLTFMNGIGQTDDIDNLCNRRIKCVGELVQNSFRAGLNKMCKTVRQKLNASDLASVTIPSLISIKPLTSAIREFFATNQLSQFLDQTNPLAELTNKRRISALGKGGLQRDRVVFEVRDVHHTHYGRICPIETPEGQTIGLINSLASYAKINDYGFIETPYRCVDKHTHRVTGDNEYLSAEKEVGYVIAESNVNIDENGYITDDFVVARINGESTIARKEDIDYIDVSPKQIVSVAAACIPFLENDDATRALMGANMQRQALPLLKPEVPFVGTGMESVVAKDSGLAVLAKEDGIVTYFDSRKIVVKGNEEITYLLRKFNRSNKETCINQISTVKVGEAVKAGQLIADGPAMKDGELALGQNVTVAFMTWNGYNFEDAVIMSERLVRDDTYTSIHIEEYVLECRDTKLGKEEITRAIPNVKDERKKYLDERGIIITGAEVKDGDILVGKVTPKGQVETSPEDKLLLAIFSNKAKEGKDTSLKVPHGGAGIVLDVKVFTKADGAELPSGVHQIVKVLIAQKRKISEGDKMSGRHGNKGVISRILPVEDMPYLPDGTPIDILLNPLGVPSRMNIGQVFEIHLGLACKALNMKIATPVFDGIKDHEIFKLMDEAKIDRDGKSVLFDGRTGERFDERIAVGIMYMIKLDHMVDDKLHARATGPYSLITQQPLGGKAQNGGQRFGEMEVWALEAYGAANTLQEMLKSDDRVGRSKTYEAIAKGNKLPKPGIPEAFRVLTKELQGLCIDVKLLDKEGQEIDLNAIAREIQADEQRATSATKNLSNASATVDDFATLDEME